MVTGVPPPMEIFFNPSSANSRSRDRRARRMALRTHRYRIAIRPFPLFLERAVAPTLHWYKDGGRPSPCRRRRGRQAGRRQPSAVRRAVPGREGGSQIFTLHKLHHQCERAIRRLDTVDVRNARMIKSGKQLGFAFESSDPIRIGGNRRRQDLQRDFTL